MPLYSQYPAPATVRTKIRLALLGSALCDALGAPAEFHARFSYAFLSEMAPNGSFGGLPPGVWTDDTSMTLALARSLGKGEFDERDQLDGYFRWWKEGELSAIGRCFDIGHTTVRGLSIYRDELRKDSNAAAERALAQIKRKLDRPSCCGNGSLMRVLPIGLAYHRDPAQAASYARRSSAPTHPHIVCAEACAAWAESIAHIVHQGVSTKLHVLHHFAVYPWPPEAAALRTALAADVPLSADVHDPVVMEAHYTEHHPLLRLLTETTAAAAADASTVEARILALLPPASSLRSSGYVVHTLVAALYAFLATPTFEDGALLTANMGDDADTVGAVYGGLAAAWYAAEDQDGAAANDALFWSPRVRTWRDALVRRDIIEQVAEELIVFAEGQQT